MMTKHSQSEQSPDDSSSSPYQKQKTPFWQRKIFWGITSGICLGLGGSLVYGWFYLQQELPTIVEAELANFLNRPVKLGTMKYVTLNRVAFKETEILPVNNDPARVSMEALAINYNLWVYLIRGKLKIQVAAIKPELYLEESQKGEWLQTPFDRLGEDHPVNLQSLTWKNATINLVFRDEEGQLKSPLQLEKTNGNLSVNPQFTLMDFSINSHIKKGELKLRGSADLAQQTAKLFVQGQELPVSELKQAIALPLELQAGTIDANLTVDSAYQRLPQIRGTATLNQVTASLPQLSETLREIEGHLLFRGEEIYLDQVTGKLKEIQGTVAGNLHPKKGLDVEVRTESTPLFNIVQSLGLPTLPIPLKGEIKSLIQIQGNPLSPKIKIDTIATKPIHIDQLSLNQFQANLQVNQTSINVDNFIATPVIGGKVQGKGIVNLETIKQKDKVITRGTDYAFKVNLQNLVVNSVLANYGQSLPLATNLTTVDATIEGDLRQPKEVSIAGSGKLQAAKGVVSIDQFYYDPKQWSAKVDLSDISLNSFPISQIQVQQSDRLNGQFIINGRSDKIDLETIDLQGTSTLTIAGGTITGKQINLSQGNWWGTFNFNQLQPQQFISQLPTSLQGSLQGEMTAKGTISDILTNLEARGRGTLTLADGTIQSQDFSLSQGQWKTQLGVDSLPLVRLIPQLPEFAQGNFSGQFQLIGRLDNNIIESLEGQGKGNLILKQGGVAVKSLEVSQGEFVTNLHPYQLNLPAISQDLKGDLNGDIILTGSLNNLDPQKINATGVINLSQGISIINRPLITVFNWQNQQLEIVEAVGDNFQGKGIISVDSDRLLTNPKQAIKSVNLQVTASHIQLNQLPLSDQIDPSLYGGNVEFKGIISGDIKQPSLNGKIAVIDLTLPDLTFEKALEGKIETNAEGTNLLLAGLNDKIDLKLDATYQPLSLSLHRQDLELQAIKQDNQVYVESQNLSLSLVQNLLKQYNPSISQLPQQLAGNISGNFTIDLDNFSVIGKKVTIQQPQFDWFKGEKLTSDLQYINNQLMLRNSQLVTANSQYNFEGDINLADSQPTIAASIEIKQGTIEDILNSFHLFDLSDFDRGLESPQYDKAADLYTDSGTVAEAGLSQANLGEQLENFNQALQEINTQKQLDTKSRELPPLSDLKGEITGTLKIRTTQDSNIEASFNLLGNQWSWGSWELNKLQLQGSLQENTLVLEPLKIQAGESLLAIEGQFSQHYQNGQIKIINVPLSPFSRLIKTANELPIKGLINADLELGGNLANPSAGGNIAINDLEIYQAQLGEIGSNFNYENGTLKFKVNSILDQKNDSVIIEGRVPYQFPFAQYQPDNDQFKVNLTIKDQGFPLLNILTQEKLIWQQGKGEVSLVVAGNIDPNNQQIKQIDAVGRVVIEDATLQSSLITDQPLTEVNSVIDLSLNQIEVKQLTGQFSGGDVAIVGTLPLRKPLENSNPLTLRFNQLAFKLPDFYQGGVQGKLEVAGTILDPTISGQIQLYDGEIILSDTLINSKQTRPKNCESEQSSPNQSKQTNQGKIVLNQENNLSAIANQTNLDCHFVKFNQLQLSLGENIRILRQPVLSFAATGGLILNGTVDNPKPSGQINLTRGQVNLLASQLQLSGNNNTVQFFPARGLDPYLTLNLATSATETTQGIVRQDPLSSEIDDPFTANRNSLQTVRIYAQVNGYAGQLEQVISLNSEPKRSQQQILTLLGGSLANLDNQDNTTVGLANLAGSAVLGTVPGEIGSALGLSEFRIFPTQIINEESVIGTSQLGIAAEAGLDLTDDISLSILKILNTDQAPQLGIRYRLNDKVLLRGSSNFDDDSRGVIEYEHRF